MKLGAFEIEEPLPRLRNLHAFATLRPWVDVGSVGRLTFRSLERHFQANDLAKLARPGVFFDFTRYRPTIYTVDGQRQVTVPPSTFVTPAVKETTTSCFSTCWSLT